MDIWRSCCPKALIPHDEKSEIEMSNMKINCWTLKQICVIFAVKFSLAYRIASLRKRREFAGWFNFAISRDMEWSCQRQCKRSGSNISNRSSKCRTLSNSSLWARWTILKVTWHQNLIQLTGCYYKFEQFYNFLRVVQLFLSSHFYKSVIEWRLDWYI